MEEEELDIDSIQKAMLEAAAEEARREYPRAYLGMSLIGDPCERKLWYAFRQYSPGIEGRTKLIFEMGNAVEKIVLNYLERAGYKVEDTQKAFTALDGLFAGHCDGIIHGVTKRPHILEIKSASSNRFKAFKKQTVVALAPQYAAQVQCYMACAKLDRALFVVMNKDTCELYTERVHYDPEYWQELEEKARGIISSNIPPDRAYPEDANECFLCPYKGHCWNAPFVQRTQTCGTCAYVRFKGLEPGCQKHLKSIRFWGRVCPDWTFSDMMDQVPF